MDYQFDSYTPYSDASSTPRTPSPRSSVYSDDVHYPSPNLKQPLDIAVNPVIYDPSEEHGIVPEPHAIKAATQMWSHAQQYNQSYPQPPGSRGSLLDELYHDDIPEQSLHPDVYHQEPAYHQQRHHHNTWNNMPQTAHGEHVASMRHPHDVSMQRRATFPYVRHDREALPYPPQSFMPEGSPSPYGSRPGTMYGEPLSMDGMPHHMDEPFAHSVSHPPLYDMIKTEDSPVIVPSQTGYCRPPSAGMHGMPCLAPHAGLLVQHTDDAASKETQYLRRRCFNCHTTEPPSWRRSTLNPGKIVCNKCGLYERTHLRPRPLRFDELRAGSKTRKQMKTAGSPKVGKLSPVVKKESTDGMDAPQLQRRSSVSSSNGSTGNGASSDWDDSVSLASSGSVPSSSFNSPAIPSFPIPRDPNSQSPPIDGGIRLPKAPLSDIASLTSSPHSRPGSASAGSPPTPRKSASASSAFYQNGQAYDGSQSGSPQIPEVTGWQSVPLSDLAPSKSKSRSNSLRKPVAAQ
ncbi:hypothetical protein BDY19DRAFT_990131 [Irpex rosettiformis]|uniref:Uncharacterized protein n=1 Tax=Irpex rosettiformis TaxID=378272 RepID=A0ACB8UDT7_9APHY|nr:hypothetical protein BDY19DRAFT_990131 [Irpex rosettiformis]